MVVKKGDASNIRTEIKLNDEISAPINKGDVLGKVEIYLNEEVIDTCNLVAEEEVKKMNSLNMFEYISNKWSNLLRK